MDNIVYASTSLFFFFLLFLTHGWNDLLKADISISFNLIFSNLAFLLFLFGRLCFSGCVYSSLSGCNFDLFLLFLFLVFLLLFGSLILQVCCGVHSSFSCFCNSLFVLVLLFLLLRRLLLSGSSNLLFFNRFLGSFCLPFFLLLLLLLGILSSLLHSLGHHFHILSCPC